MSESLITVYSNPACMQCEMTKRAFDKTGVEYRVVDITTSPQVMEWITEDLGYAATPVVFVEDGTVQSHWAAFRPDRVKSAIAWVDSHTQGIEAVVENPKERLMFCRSWIDI